MTIKIDFTDNVSITKETSSFDIRDVESISLTAADFTEILAISIYYFMK